MQMTGGATTRPGNKSPPPPMVQQSVGAGTSESAGHSRNVSQGSAKSQQPAGQKTEVVPPPVETTVVGAQEGVAEVTSTIPAAVAVVASSPIPETKEEEQEELQTSLPVDEVKETVVGVNKTP